MAVTFAAPRRRRAAVGAKTAASPAHQSGVPASVHSALARPGKPLALHDRALMEARFGGSFAGVRIVDDALGRRSADAIGADAYSFGSKIVFGERGYRSDDARSRSLLSHELAHVMQQPHVAARPRGITTPTEPAERDAHAAAVATGRPHLTVSPDLVRRQAKSDAPQTPAPGAPAPADPEQAAKAAPAAKSEGDAKGEGSTQSAAAPDLGERVRKYLDDAKFDLPVVANPEGRKSGELHVIYGGMIKTLDQVTDDVTDIIGQTMFMNLTHAERREKLPDMKTHLRTQIWSEVWQYYNKKLLDAEGEKNKWSILVQLLYTPQYNFYASAAGGTGWQNPLQGSLSLNRRFHRAGGSGLELQVNLPTLSLFNLGSGHRDTGDDWFQNVMASIQAQYVFNLGSEFRLPTGDFANVQAALIAQLGAGAGGNWALNAEGERKVYVGFLVQPAAGGQINLNIGKLQVILQGEIVYSYLGRTSMPGSTPTQSTGVQFGIGIGGNFSLFGD